MEELEFSKINPVLLEGLDGDTDGWKLYRHPLNMRGSIQIVFSEEHNRAGLIYIGDGTNNRDDWTDAESPEDALERWLMDDMTN